MNRSAVVVAVGALLVAAAGIVMWLVVGGDSSKDEAQPPLSTSTSLPDPPEEWPAVDARTAAAVQAFLAGDGRVLVDLRSATGPVLGGLDASSCEDVVAAVEELDAGEALSAATGVPDAPLSAMFVNLTGQASEVVTACNTDDLVDAEEITADLATTDAYVAVRLAQVEAAA